MRILLLLCISCILVSCSQQDKSIESIKKEEQEIKNNIIELERELLKENGMVIENGVYAQIEEGKKEIQKEKQKTQWQYEKTQDKLRDTERYIARIESDNSAFFSFPYSGGSRLQILMRNWKDDNDVMFIITKGQFMGSWNGDEHISVRFDDGSVQKFYYVNSDDGDSSVIFLNNEESFIRQMRKAKSLIIEAPFYSEGVKQFEFGNVEGVDF